MPQFEEGAYFKGDLANVYELAALFMTRANWKIHDTGLKLMGSVHNIEEVWNEMQPYHMKPMCEAYFDTFNIHTFIATINTHFSNSKETNEMFEKVLRIYVYQAILGDAEYFIGHEIFSKTDFDDIKGMVMQIFKELRPESLALTDVFPYEFGKNYGPLGHKELNVYEEFMQKVIANDH